MRIKFKAPDPRAGMVAQMDSHRGQQLVDAGAAVRVNEDGTEIAAPPADPPASLPRPEGLGPEDAAAPAPVATEQPAGKKAKAKK